MRLVSVCVCVCDFFVVCCMVVVDMQSNGKCVTVDGKEIAYEIGGLF